MSVGLLQQFTVDWMPTFFAYLVASDVASLGYSQVLYPLVTSSILQNLENKFEHHLHINAKVMVKIH